MTTGRDHAPLTLADLEQFDPGARTSGSERRFLCPFTPCSDKRQNNSHRSLVANVTTGAWQCHRCGRDGSLRDFWRKPDTDLRERWVAKSAPHSRDRAPRPAPRPLLTRDLDDACAAYLARRGLSLELATWNDVRLYVGKFQRRWLVFQLFDAEKRRVAVQCRRIDAGAGLQHFTYGPKSTGLFVAKPRERAWSNFNVVVEAPMDALSIAAAGLFGLATCGTAWADWLPRTLARRPWKRVLLGQDADDAGDEAAVKMSALLSALGADPVRVRPHGGKDWNAVLMQAGVEGVCHQLQEGVSA